MNLLDNMNSYGLVSRLNHWLGAALVIALLAIGLYFHEMPRGEEKLFWLKLHMGIGALVLPYLLFRVIWRVFANSPQPLPQEPVPAALTFWGHRLLLALILVLLVSGPLMVWSGGYEVELFGLLSIPGPIGKAIDIIEAEPERRKKLWENADRLKSGLESLGFDTGITETPIIPILVGDDRKTFEFWRLIFDAGVFANPVITASLRAPALYAFSTLAR